MTSVQFINGTGEDLLFTRTDPPPTPVNPAQTFTILADAATTQTLNVGTYWAIKGVKTSTIYLPFNVVVNSSLVPKQLFIYPANRPLLPNTKHVIWWLLIVLWVIAIIILAVSMSKSKDMQIAEQCAAKQMDADMCNNAIDMGTVSSSTGGYVFAIVVSVIAVIVLSVVWMFDGGPLRYSVDCNTCEQRGNDWNWVRPKSSFQSLLCSMFGICECAADDLAGRCNAGAVLQTGNKQVWDEKNAALATKGVDSACYCCAGTTCSNTDNSLTKCK